MEIRLDGKRALVTGGNSGIGEAVVLALAGSGARVAINYVTHPEAAQSLVRRVQETGGEAMALQADVSDEKGVTAMFRQIADSWGGLDILVNNAGIDGERAMAWESETGQWRKVIDVNLMGTYFCSREALRGMVASKNGVIVTITSVHEEIAWSGYSAYTASKAALGMLTKNLAQEAAPYGVRVVAVAPGAIGTSINRSVWTDPRGLKDLMSKIAMARIGEPEEVARMVVVLASDTASYVTGCTVLVDGGMTDYPDFTHGG